MVDSITKYKKLSRKFFARETKIVARELLGKVLARKIGGKVMRAVITETEAYCGPNDMASHASKGRTPRTEVMFGRPGLIYVYLIYGMYHCLNIVTEREDYPAAVLIRGAELTNSNLSRRLCIGIPTGASEQIPNCPSKCESRPTPGVKEVPTRTPGVKEVLTRTPGVKEVPTPGVGDLNGLPRSEFPVLSNAVKPQPEILIRGPGKLCRYFQIDRSLNKQDLIKNGELWVENWGIKLKPGQIKSAPRVGVDYAGKHKDKKWRYYVKF